MILLSTLDLTLASLLVIALAICSWRMRLGITGQIIVAALRTTAQLLLIGLVLRLLFASQHLGTILAITVVMLLAAGREVMARQQHHMKGWWAYGLGTGAMFVSSFSITLLALLVMVQADPWYAPHYSIPLLGMLLGNTMNGVSLSLNRLTQAAFEQKEIIHQRLLLGHTRLEVLDDIRRDAMRTGMIPIINSMAAAGLVSLPGMMTGQILAGSPPVEAVKYQILIMFLIAAGTGGGILTGITLASRRLFDERQRLRLDRFR